MDQTIHPVSAAPAAPPVPSLVAASLRVFDLSLWEMLWSRRTVFLALVVGAPVVMALCLRVLDVAHSAGMRVNGVKLGGTALFSLMLWGPFLRAIIPLLGVFYGTSLIADEVEDKTITYLFTRPIRRSAVLIGKYLAYLASTVLIVLPAVMLVYFLVVPIGGGSIAATFLDLIRDLALLAAGLAVYGAVFAAVGAWIKRPVLAGLLYVFGWEVLALSLPGYLKRFTVAFYLKGLVPGGVPQQDVVSMLESYFRESVPAIEAIAVLAAIMAVSLALAARAVERREYVLEQ